MHILGASRLWSRERPAALDWAGDEVHAPRGQVRGEQRTPARRSLKKNTSHPSIRISLHLQVEGSFARVSGALGETKRSCSAPIIGEASMQGEKSGPHTHHI